ncbi:hypothetical protein O181_024774, partial [Austropuccinia psidii MF-1]|nr:hypothetical protein [Austropuccinia psidii MF-1]
MRPKGKWRKTEDTPVKFPSHSAPRISSEKPLSRKPHPILSPTSLSNTNFPNNPNPLAHHQPIFPHSHPSHYLSP